MVNEMTVMRKELAPMAVMNPDLNVMLEVMPEGAELEGVFGVGTNQGFTTENGIVLQGVIELGLK